MNAAEKRSRKLIRNFFALMGSTNKEESESAKHKLENELKKLGKTWNDLPELLQDSSPEQSPSEPPPDPRDTEPPYHTRMTSTLR